MAGKDAFGTKFEKETATPDTYEAVANVSDINPPGIEREALDVTAHDSPNGYMEYIGGLKNGGEVSITVNYDPSAHDELVADMDDPDPINYRITWPTAVGGSWEFSAVMTGFSPAAPVDDKLSAEITFQVSGKPTLSAGV